MTKRKSLSKRARFDVLRRDEFTCRYCGRRPPEVELAVDHIVAVVNGGGNDIRNLATACVDCNHGKATEHAQPPSVWWKAREEWNRWLIIYLSVFPQGRRLLAYVDRLYGQEFGFGTLEHTLGYYYHVEYIWGLKDAIVPYEYGKEHYALYRALPRAVRDLEQGTPITGSQFYALQQACFEGRLPPVVPR